MLRMAGAAGLSSLAWPWLGGRTWAAARPEAGRPLFEEIPPSASGITWVHTNAMSAERYLPETMGPGVAFLDYDNDGWMDIYMVNSDLRNNAGPENHWVGLRVQGTSCNRDAVGALVSWSVGGVKRSRLKTAGGSYLSSHDPRDVLGLGAATRLDWLEIKWPAPSGRVERFTEVPVDRYLTVVEGRGIV